MRVRIKAGGRVRSCCWRRTAPRGIVRVRGVRGGGWKGEAVRRGVNISDEEDEVDHGREEGMAVVGMLGSVRRL